MIHCTTCGQELPDTARFCSRCGKAVGTTQTASAEGRDTAGDGNGQRQPGGGDPAERIWTGWPSRKRHLPMLAVWLVVAIIGLIGGAAGVTALLILAAVGGLGVLWTAGRMLLEPLMLRYWLTCDRLFIRRGLLRITTDQTELIRVEDIRVHQGVIDRVLGIGHVEVVAGSDATDGHVTLVGVNDPMRVAELVRSGMQSQRRRRGMYVENV